MKWRIFDQLLNKYPDVLISFSVLRFGVRGGCTNNYIFVCLLCSSQGVIRVQ